MYSTLNSWNTIENSNWKKNKTNEPGSEKLDGLCDDKSNNGGNERVIVHYWRRRNCHLTHLPSLLICQIVLFINKQINCSFSFFSFEKRYKQTQAGTEIEYPLNYEMFFCYSNGLVYFLSSAQLSFLKTCFPCSITLRICLRMLTKMSCSIYLFIYLFSSC